MGYLIGDRFDQVAQNRSVTCLHESLYRHSGNQCLLSQLDEFVVVDDQPRNVIVRFKDLSLSDLTLTEIDNADGFINGDELELSWNKDGYSGVLRLAHMGQYIERFEFADGTRLSQIAFQQDGFAELIGTSSSDWIAGTAGDDFLTGAGGADTFVFTETSGTDRVTDFTDGEDLIRIERSALTFEDLVLEASGTDALVRFDGSTIVLQGVDLSELDRGDFLFT